MDAETIVNMAKLWKNVPEKMECKVSGSKQSLGSRSRSGNSLTIGENDIHELVFRSYCNITSLEHVQVVVNIDHPSRGQLEVLLVSPAGTKTHLLSPRPNDLSSKGFQDWVLTSVETWGENGDGEWHLYIVSRGGPGVQWSVGHCHLVLHGFHSDGR